MIDGSHIFFRMGVIEQTSEYMEWKSVRLNRVYLHKVLLLPFDHTGSIVYNSLTYTKVQSVVIGCQFTTNGHVWLFNRVPIYNKWTCFAVLTSVEVCYILYTSFLYSCK